MLITLRCCCELCSCRLPSAQTESTKNDPSDGYHHRVMYYAPCHLLCYLGYTVLYRPLVAGTLMVSSWGPAEGMPLAQIYNVLYLGGSSAVALCQVTPPPRLAGYLGTALAFGGGLSNEAAMLYGSTWTYWVV